MTGPWAALPRGFGDAIRRERSSVAADVIREIRTQVPEFGRPLAGQFGTGIRVGVEAALADFADLVDGAGPDTDPDRMRVYRRLGRGELTEGRSLDALQAAYRVGARVAWRRYARVARRLGLRPDHMVVLAEAIFAHIDEIAAESVRGYTRAEADRAGTRAFQRHRLLGMLIDGAPGEAVERAADAAGWRMPRRVACAALDPGSPGGEFPYLPESVLADLDRPDAYLLLPDPADAVREEHVARILSRRCAVVGPSVPVAMAGDSLRWARAVREHRPDQAAGAQAPDVPDDAPVFCDDRLSELLLLADSPLIRLIAERRLAVLDALTPKQRRRLEETLLVWLQTNHTAPEVAARLGIHPQTARHRLHQIQHLFGPELADPDIRFEIEVALRSRVR